MAGWIEIVDGIDNCSVPFPLTNYLSLGNVKENEEINADRS